MKFNRASGVILHPTSLPGPYGIGDLGSQVFHWLDFLNEAGCALWQVLPLGPTGYGDSPYQCFSAFAGNPYLISPEILHEDMLLNNEDLDSRPDFPSGKVDFGAVISWKLNLLDKAYAHFKENSSRGLRKEFEQFQTEQSFWLDDFALFMAIKAKQGGGSWSEWPKPLRLRQPEAIANARRDLADAILRIAFVQFLFFRQWNAVHEYAKKLEIQIIGDIPIFVSHDSADVWAHLDLFYMDKEGFPTVVAGVPPDYFSPTGQLWGNPLYRWDIHASNGYAWWLDRFRTVLKMVDIVRLDHFRGFAGYWEIPAGNPTAEIGRWVPGPGKDFFEAVRKGLGELPIIAEDLGVITPDVVDLRETFNLPSMKVLQFAFLTTPDDTFMPHNYPRNCVVYTGTHDNDTSLGWFKTIPEQERKFCLEYLERDGKNIVWEMIRAVWGSVGMFSLAPMQDLLNLGSEARMNFPGKPSGNWSWRMPADSTSEELCSRLKKINYLYNRLKPMVELK